jgi:hypothetical protein
MHYLTEQIESQALDRAQKLFRRLGGQITQVSDLIITNDIILYTKCYVHSYNRLVKSLG